MKISSLLRTFWPMLCLLRSFWSIPYSSARSHKPNLQLVRNLINATFSQNQKFHKPRTPCTPFQRSLFLSASFQNHFRIPCLHKRCSGGFLTFLENFVSSFWAIIVLNIYSNFLYDFLGQIWTPWFFGCYLEQFFGCF